MQIGPKIRIGGTLGHLGQEAKIGLGKIAKNPFVDAAVSFIPGVGPVAAGALGALGTAMDTSGGSVGLGQIGLHGLEGYGAAKFAHMLPGIGGGGESSVTAGLPGVQVTPGAGVNAMQQGVMDRVMGGANAAGHFITNNKAALETAGNVAGGVMNANAQNKQLAIQQQGANDQSAQVQAALAKQQAIRDGFAKMYAGGMGGAPQGPPQQQAPGAPPPAMAATMPPTDPNDAQRKLMQRLGYAPPPSYGSGY